MTGELDDPLLQHGIGEGDSNLGGGHMDDDDGFIDNKLGKSSNYHGGGFDDSELSNGIVGIDTSKKPRV